MAYKRSTDNEFNVHLAKCMCDGTRDGGRKQTNIERAQANVDKWLAEQEAYKARGEKTPWVLAMQRNQRVPHNSLRTRPTTPHIYPPVTGSTQLDE
jgi:hypothetical protein